MSNNLPTERAIEAFLRGFTTTRSFTHPFLIHALAENIWLMADGPSKSKSRKERGSEVVAYRAETETVLEAIRTHGVGRHSLCVLLDPDDDREKVNATYKQLGYRLIAKEPLFVVETKNHVPFPNASIRRVTTEADAEAVRRVARTRQLLPIHLKEEDPTCRLYAAFVDETTVGFVRSIRTHPDCAWVSNLFVQPDSRRQGLGRALMSAMLTDDTRHGLRWSVLLASLTGAKLYPHLGYEKRGLLLLFSPRKTTP